MWLDKVFNFPALVKNLFFLLHHFRESTEIRLYTASVNFIMKNAEHLFSRFSNTDRDSKVDKTSKYGYKGKFDRFFSSFISTIR